MVIRWSKIAELQLRKIYNFIKEDSPANAAKVVTGLIELSESLAVYPGRFPADKYKINNDGTYRAVELYHYRLSYRVMEKEIVILRLRHTAMSPRIY